MMYTSNKRSKLKTTHSYQAKDLPPDSGGSRLSGYMSLPRLIERKKLVRLLGDVHEMNQERL